jgi:hypothetical protein
MPRRETSPHMDNHSHDGHQRLALAVIRDALHQWDKRGAQEAREFLESDMFPFLDAADLELDDVRLRQALRKSGLVPLSDSENT